jgi:hypothetical protein
VPAYSSIRLGSGRGKVDLATTLSIHNTSHSYDSPVITTRQRAHRTGGALPPRTCGPSGCRIRWSLWSRCRTVFMSSRCFGASAFHKAVTCSPSRKNQFASSRSRLTCRRNASTSRAMPEDAGRAVQGVGKSITGRAAASTRRKDRRCSYAVRAQRRQGAPARSDRQRYPADPRRSRAVDLHLPVGEHLPKLGEEGDRGQPGRHDRRVTGGTAADYPRRDLPRRACRLAEPIRGAPRRGPGDHGHCPGGAGRHHRCGGLAIGPTSIRSHRGGSTIVAPLFSPSRRTRRTMVSWMRSRRGLSRPAVASSASEESTSHAANRSQRSCGMRREEAWPGRIAASYGCG